MTTQIVVLQHSKPLGYLNSKLMLRWEGPCKWSTFNIAFPTVIPTDSRLVVPAHPPPPKKKKNT